MATTPYASPGRDRRVVGGTLLVAVLAAAQLPLLYVHLNPFAPARQDFGRATPVARNAADLDRLGRSVAAAVSGRSVEFHLQEPSPPPAAQDLLVAGLYYRMNYALFPARAVAGDGTRTVNDAATLRAADVLPPDDRLAGRSAVVTFAVAPATGVATHVRLLDTARR